MKSLISCQNLTTSIFSLIKHTETLLEEKEEKLCVKVLKTLREMMAIDPEYGEKVKFFFILLFVITFIYLSVFNMLLRMIKVKNLKLIWYGFVRIVL